jgi:menaquinol-cytochrome c reductase iron-sulfur subunit
MESHSRRSFLKKLLGIVAALFAGLLPGRSQAGWFGGGSKDRWVSIGKLADLPDGKNTPIKTATEVDSGKPVKRPKIIANRRGEQVHVMSTRCTHFGCEVELQPNGTYNCPCHGAQYDKVGVVTKGPAKKALPWCDVKVTEAGEVQVNLNSDVAAPKLD